MEKINWEILAFLRFILASVVMIGHLSDGRDIGFLKVFTYLGSFEAILGFLVVSGFSIGKSIIRNQEDYLKRRIFRIYPVYIASILFGLLTSSISSIHINFHFMLTFFINFFFLNNIVAKITDSHFLFNTPAWTLNVEVWMYCLAPFLLKLKKNTLVFLIFASFICYLSYESGRTLFHWPYYFGTMYGINLVLLAFIWITGFCLAIFPESNKLNRRIIIFLFTGHLLLKIGIQIIFRIKHHSINELIREDVACFIGNIICLTTVYFIIFYSFKASIFKPFTKRVFNLLGNISYPLYLTHCTTFGFLATKYNLKNPFLLILAAITISYLIYATFDFYSRKRALS